MLSVSFKSYVNKWKMLDWVRRAYVLNLIICVMVQVVDIFQTYIGLSKFPTLVYEANPLMRVIMDRLGMEGFVLTKISIGFIQVLGYEMIRQRDLGKPRQMLNIMRMGNIFTTGITLLSAMNLYGIAA